MSVQRSIVQKLFESKGLYESSFEVGGSTYKCAFGRYYKDGEEISRDEYFNAKEQEGTSESSPDRGNSGSSPKKDTSIKLGDEVQFLGDDYTVVGVSPEDENLLTLRPSSMMSDDAFEGGGDNSEDMYIDKSQVTFNKFDSSGR